MPAFDELPFASGRRVFGPRQYDRLVLGLNFGVGFLDNLERLVCGRFVGRQLRRRCGNLGRRFVGYRLRGVGGIILPVAAGGEEQGQGGQGG